MSSPAVNNQADVVICGAGVAGLAAAHWLALSGKFERVVIVDELPPLTLTSDKSTECYRNWWPGPGDAMVGLMNRSIGLMEALAGETNNAFSLNRRGYLYATADLEQISTMREAALEAAELGSGPLREHTTGSSNYMPPEPEGFESTLTGADLITDQSLIRKHFPALSEDIVAVLHARRCGWLSAQQLGMTLLERARAHGAELMRGRVVDVELQNGHVAGVQVETQTGVQQIATPVFINAAGPNLKRVGEMLGVNLPVFSELHYKISFEDSKRVVPRDVPMLIWLDETSLPWSEEERALISEDPDRHWLLEPLPGGVHTRPEGGPESETVLAIWTFHTNPVEPTFPILLDAEHHEVALRGLSRMMPGLEVYFENLPKPVLDGGYYTKTRENRPLVGPAPVSGAYVIGALSGFGIMASCAVGELLAAHVLNYRLPDYAGAFELSRYEDPEYQKLLENWGSTGQL